MSEASHENGRVNRLVEKQEEKRMVLERDASDQTKAQTKETKSMLWEKSTNQGEKALFKATLALVLDVNNEPVGPIDPEIESGPLAMVYDETKGWIAEKMGLNSRHWKPLAQEIKKESKSEEKGPKSLKREGLTLLCEIDPNVLDVKCIKEGRNEGKQIRRSSDDEMKMVGGEVVVARQHRRAS